MIVPYTFTYFSESAGRRRRALAESRKPAYKVPYPNIYRSLTFLFQLLTWPVPAVNMTASTSKANKAHAVSHATEPLDNDIARVYSHIHPLVILGVFYFQFDSLVESPVKALPTSALIVAILQVLYLCVCIPGSNHSSLHSKKPGQKKKAAGKDVQPGIGFKLVVRICSKTTLWA